VRTSGLVAGRHLKSGHRHDRHNTAYYGIAPSVFEALMKRWRKSGPAALIEEFSLIDIGAGMGRAVLMAARCRSRRGGGGTECHAGRDCAANLTLWRAAGRARAPMKIVCQDAVEFQLPHGPCLALLFNPFGAPVLRRLLAGWRKVLADARETWTCCM